MTNPRLEIDYVNRAEHRLVALQILFDRGSYADVMREAQEIVELSLKALLRKSGVSTPQIHDVGQIVLREAEKLPQVVRADAQQMARISKELRKDREIAFYGSEDIVPSEFYDREDAEKALNDARWLHQRVKVAVLVAER